LFWGSGVLKDGLIFFCTGLSLYFLDQLLTIGKKSFNLFASLLFLCLIFFVKVHVFFIFLPCYIAYGWSIQNNKQIMSKYLIVCGASIILLLLFPLLNPDINFLQYLANKQYEFIKLAHEAKAGSIINVNTLEPNITSVIKNSPVAFFNTLFRPHLLDSRSPLILLSALENTFIIVLTVFIFSSGIYNRRKISPMFYFSVFYVISSFILIGLIIPVMGAIVRYKVQALPYLFFILFFVVDREKVLKKFPFLNFLFK
jgi:4-amino-4-deoxy-L-arabinose transferase-like glycosyltransferase